VEHVRIISKGPHRLEGTVPEGGPGFRGGGKPPFADRLNGPAVLCMIGPNPDRGGMVGRGNRAFKSEKRTKELRRLKKQEEKRLRRLGKLTTPEEPEVFSPDEAPAAPPKEDDTPGETS